MKADQDPRKYSSALRFKPRWCVICLAIVFADVSYGTSTPLPAGTPPDIVMDGFKSDLVDGIRSMRDSESMVNVLPTTHWSRLSGGVWLGLSNHGVLKHHFALSEDSVLLARGTDQLIGGGFFIDLPVQGQDDVSWRFMLGGLKWSGEPDSEWLAEYPANAYESSGQVAVLRAIVRQAILHFGYRGRVWWGGGAELLYMISSRSPGTVPVETRLSTSLFTSALLSLGWDYPVTRWTDASLGMEYRPLGGLSFWIGMRGSL